MTHLGTRIKIRKNPINQKRHTTPTKKRGAHKQKEEETKIIA
jgi:hypothetical protein